MSHLAKMTREPATKRPEPLALGARVSVEGVTAVIVRRRWHTDLRSWVYQLDREAGGKRYHRGLETSC